MARFVASFLNNALLEAIDSVRSFKPFEPIPNRSKSIEVAKNRVFLAGNDDGYAQQGGSISISLQNAPGSANYPLYAAVWLEETSSGTYSAGALLSQSIVNRRYFFTGYCINIGGLYYLVTFNSALNIWETSGKAVTLAELSTEILTPLENPYSQIVLGVEVPFTGTRSKVTRKKLQVSLVSNITTTIPNPGGTTNWGACVQEIANRGPNSVTVDVSAAIGFMDGTQYKVGLVWYDQNLKNAGVTAVVDVNIPRTAAFQPRQVNYTITAGSSSIPSWAHAAQVVITKCLNMDSFIYHETTDVWYYKGDGDDGSLLVGKDTSERTAATFILVDIYSLILNDIGYVFNEANGDYIEIVIGSTIYSIRIVGQRGRYLFLEKTDLGDLSAISVGEGNQIRVPMRIYTPKRVTSQDVFYEIGEVHAVNNPGQVNRSLATNSGVLIPSTFVIKRNRHTFVGSPAGTNNVKLAVYNEPVLNMNPGAMDSKFTTTIVAGKQGETGFQELRGEPAQPKDRLSLVEWLVRQDIIPSKEEWQRLTGKSTGKDPSSDGDIQLPTGAIFRRAIKVDGRTLSVFAMSPSDKRWYEWPEGMGRAVVVLSEPKSRTNAQEIFPSEVYIPNSRYNTLNEFEVANRESVPVDIGNVQKIILVDKTSQDEGTVMMAICSNGTASMYLGETVLRDQSGQEILTTSQKVIGTIRTFMGRYGTRHPLSVVAADGRVYWWDQTNRCVVRYASNGLMEISRKEMWSYFSEIAETATRFVMGYDPINKYVFLSFKNPDATWVYAEARERWIGRVSAVPTLYGRAFDCLLLTDGASVKSYRKIGSVTPARATSWFAEFFASPSPSAPSQWMGMTVNGSKPNQVDFTAQAEYLMQSDLASSDFETIEGVQYAPILRDVNTPNVSNPLFNGDPLYSVYLKVKMAFNAAGAFVNAVWIGFKRSSGPQ